LVSGTATDINGIFNTNEDSLANKLKDDFYNNLDGALDDCEKATSDWKIAMKPLVDEVGISFDGEEASGKKGLSHKIKNTTTESKNLRDYIVGSDGLIEGIKDEWEEVETATEKWQNHWNKIGEVIT
jgi:hypothetical protein